MKGILIASAKVTTALAGAIIVTFVLAVFLWFFTDAEPVRNPHLNVEDLPFIQIDSVNDVETVLARPLFWQEREPVEDLSEVAAQGAEATVAPLRDIQLLGIVLAGDVRKALLRVEGKITPVLVGQVIQNWTVEEITTKDITFAGEEQRQTLSLVRERPSSIELEASE
ncbi:MAG: hypothetical protein RBR82_01670 [Pseudomonas sp.]|jgi:CBS domain-containing protein|nr:hypothetical protein [Pseudomonas sp.]